MLEAICGHFFPLGFLVRISLALGPGPYAAAQSIVDLLMVGSFFCIEESRLLMATLMSPSSLWKNVMPPCPSSTSSLRSSSWYSPATNLGLSF